MRNKRSVIDLRRSALPGVRSKNVDRRRVPGANFLLFGGIHSLILTLAWKLEGAETIVGRPAQRSTEGGEASPRQSNTGGAA